MGRQEKCGNWNRKWNPFCSSSDINNLLCLAPLGWYLTPATLQKFTGVVTSSANRDYIPFSDETASLVYSSIKNQTQMSASWKIFICMLSGLTSWIVDNYILLINNRTRYKPKLNSKSEQVVCRASRSSRLRRRPGLSSLCHSHLKRLKLSKESQSFLCVSSKGK